MGKIQEAIERARKAHRVMPGSLEHFDGDDQNSINSTKGPGTLRSGHWPARSIDVVESALLEERVIAGLDFDVRTEPYRQLRTQVLKLMHDNGWKSLAVTSAHESAGKTLTAVNLAISISRDVNHNALIVDLDLRNPSVHQKMGITVTNGLVDCLDGTAELGDVLINPGYERLFILPGKPTAGFATELLASPEMRQLMNDLSDDNDASRIILFDLPPLLRNDDALVITAIADATLLVVEDGVTTKEQLDLSLQMLKGANLIGTVLNKVRV